MPHQNKSPLKAQIKVMAVSMLIAELAAWAYPVDQSFWIPLTTFCVCLYIDTPLTALRRTVHRIGGSICGVIIAGLICLLFPSESGLMTFLVIFAGLTLWSRAFTSLYYLFVSCITAATIMLLAILMRHTALTPNYLITERVIFTTIGAIISLAVSAVIMPATEKPDMLRTYRHYLTRFYLEYRLCIYSLRNHPDTPEEKTNIRVNEILKSSRVYQEKLPVWRYALFFNVFIFRSFTRFLHRIHKMRILNMVLISSIGNLPENLNFSDEIKTLLERNRILTKRILLSLMNLDRKRSEQYLTELHSVNNELETLLHAHRSCTTILIAVRDLEQDMVHLKNGAVQIYLGYRNQKY
jgi:uncharacterized membrane protein YgaE (UPF0421/DUF939 family)